MDVRQGEGSRRCRGHTGPPGGVCATITDPMPVRLSAARETPLGPRCCKAPAPRRRRSGHPCRRDCNRRGAPVVAVLPAEGERPQLFKLAPLGAVADRFRVGPARCRKPGAQIVKRSFRNGDAERPDGIRRGGGGGCLRSGGGREKDTCCGRRRPSQKQGTAGKHGDQACLAGGAAPGLGIRCHDRSPYLTGASSGSPLRTT